MPAPKDPIAYEIWRAKKSAAMKGRVFAPEHRAKIGAAQRGELGNNWKGDSVGYRGMHKRVRQQRGEPRVCSSCVVGQKGLQWADTAPDGLSLDVNDYVPLCKSCHIWYDKQRVKDVRRAC